jgi:Ras-related protein Rab-1A
LGSKADITAKKVVDSYSAQDFANELGVPFLETSAKDSNNEEQAFMIIA